MSAPGLDRLSTKGWYGDALYRSVSIGTRGWWDVDYSPVQRKYSVFGLADRYAISTQRKFATFGLSDRYTMNATGKKLSVYSLGDRYTVNCHL